jgi:hypothetical protein
MAAYAPVGARAAFLAVEVAVIVGEDDPAVHVI